MRRMIRAAVILAVLFPAVGARAADDVTTKNYVLSACEAMVEGKPVSTFSAGRCIGILEGLEIGNLTNYCPSGDITIRQRLKVIKSYVEARPDQRNEAFVVLAAQAFEEAWPCRSLALGKAEAVARSMSCRGD